jgi:membrane-anchored protein YejM (alkaline phosphatase superfamily)
MNMWSTIKERLKSKVVWGQLVASFFVLLAALTGKDYTQAQDVAQMVLGTVYAVYGVFAAINNPADPDHL